MDTLDVHPQQQQTLIPVVAAAAATAAESSIAPAQIPLTAVSTAEYFLTQEQHRLINQRLPKGFSLQFAPKPIRQKSCSFTKVPASAMKLENQQQRSQFSTPAAVPSRQQSINLNQQLQQPTSTSTSFCTSTTTTMTADRDFYSENYSIGGTTETDQLEFQNQQFQYQQPQQQLQYNQYQASVEPKVPANNSTNNRAKKPVKRNQNANANATAAAAATTGAARNQKRKGESLAMPPMQKQINRGSPISHNLSGMNSDDSKKCFNILHSLQKHKSAGPFLYPVDPLRQGCPDYFSVVRDPMDLSTVERNLKSNMYQSRTQFAADIRKIWNNSFIYNARESQIYNMTLEMDKFFEKKFTEAESVNQDANSMPMFMKLIAQAINSSQNNLLSAPMVGAVAAAASTAKTAPNRNRQPASQKAKPKPKQAQQKKPAAQQFNRQAPANETESGSSSKKSKKAPSKMDTPMTMQEKKNLGAAIMQLPHDNLRGIWEIVKTDDKQEYDGNVLRFDLDTLSVRKTRELEQYVKQKSAAAAKKLTKKQAKIDEKALDNNNNNNKHHAYQMDDETATTNHDVLHTQDMTQSTITPGMTQSHLSMQTHQTQINHHQQQQQMKQHPHYAAPHNFTQQYQDSHPQQLSHQQVQHQHQHQHHSHHNHHIDHDDNDSDSSFMSEDSDSQDQ